MELEEVLICECCNYIIDDDDYTEWDGRIICSDCLEEHTTICDCCGSRIWRDDAYSDENTTVCTDCYEEHYTRCSCCDALLYEDEAYYSNGDAYCRDCYEEEREDSDLIHEYSYKPNPIFYGDGNRYFGIELEVNAGILDDPKYDYLFTVEDVNRLVLGGVPFREAYRQVGMAVQRGQYRPTREVRHTHEGSIGNLCTAEIRRKMERVMAEFE